MVAHQKAYIRRDHNRQGNGVVPDQRNTSLSDDDDDRDNDDDDDDVDDDHDDLDDIIMFYTGVMGGISVKEIANITWYR